MNRRSFLQGAALAIAAGMAAPKTYSQTALDSRQARFSDRVAK